MKNEKWERSKGKRRREGTTARAERGQSKQVSEKKRERKRTNKKKRRENKGLMNERISNDRKRELQRGSAGGRVPSS